MTQLEVNIETHLLHGDEPGRHRESSSKDDLLAGHGGARKEAKEGERAEVAQGGRRRDSDPHLQVAYALDHEESALGLRVELHEAEAHGDAEVQHEPRIVDLVRVKALVHGHAVINTINKIGLFPAADVPWMDNRGLDDSAGSVVWMASSVAGDGVGRVGVSVGGHHDHVGEEALLGGRVAAPEVAPVLEKADGRVPDVAESPLGDRDDLEALRRHDYGLRDRDLMEEIRHEGQGRARPWLPHQQHDEEYCCCALHREKRRSGEDFLSGPAAASRGRLSEWPRKLSVHYLPSAESVRKSINAFNI